MLQNRINSFTHNPVGVFLEIRDVRIYFKQVTFFISGFNQQIYRD